MNINFGAEEALQKLVNGEIVPYMIIKLGIAVLVTWLASLFVFDLLKIKKEQRAKTFLIAVLLGIVCVIWYVTKIGPDEFLAGLVK